MEIIRKDSPAAVLRTEGLNTELIQVLERYYTVVIGKTENGSIVIELYDKRK